MKERNKSDTHEKGGSWVCGGREGGRSELDR